MSESQEVRQLLTQAIQGEKTAQAYFESLLDDISLSSDHEQFKSMAAQSIRHQRLVTNLMSMLKTKQ